MGGNTAPMYEVRISGAEELLARAESLFAEHWEEIALSKHLMVLKPDADRYRAMEQAGMLLALGVWNGDELIGYSVNFIMRHLHYADLSVAANDLVFVSKAHRNTRAGLMLIRETERRCKERGAQLLTWHAKKDTPLASLMPRIGYAVQDIIFSREL